MDSSSCLDYILFQLTPTRTRCDLVIFAGKLNEKLAYGLLEPFIAHLRSAKDQISKGGYSITLQPPSSGINQWFTKATLQRFVRFVSTPEVLERFVTIEREIGQLENSIKSSSADIALGTETDVNGTTGGGNIKHSASLSKQKNDTYDNDDLVKEENSKVRLHRVLETRRAVLRKEQAMVYARALAAGYEMDNLDDLLLFSDAFGASRLREACIHFKVLCKKKNEDRFWVDEIAAMQAIVQPDLSFMGTSGIILAGEDNITMGSTEVSMSDSFTSHGSSDANHDSGVTQTLPADAKAQISNAWVNQFPPHLRNFQGPVYQQMPPYQGYGFPPGMQVAPSYYPANMQWPTNANGLTDHESHDYRDHKSSSRKKKKKKSKGSKRSTRGSDHEEHDESSNSSGSSSETESDSSFENSRKKRHGKKSSRKKVVIRNINYISSKRDGEEVDSSNEDDHVDGDSLKQQLEDVVGSFERHQKSSKNKKHNGSKHLPRVNGSGDQDDEDVSLKNINGNKGNENWDAFQHLLLRDDEPVSNAPKLNLESEEKAKQNPISMDAFLVGEKGAGNYSNTNRIPVENFDPTESYCPAIRRESGPDEFLFVEKVHEPEIYARVAPSDDVAHDSVIRSQTSDDWFIGKQSNETGRLGDYVAPLFDQVEKKRKEVIIDDSLMIHGRQIDDQTESQMRRDLSFVDSVEASTFANGTVEVPQKISESLDYFEPNDLYMVLDRYTAVEQPVQSWTPEMDYENNVSTKDSVKKLSDVDSSMDPNLTSNEKGPNSKKSGASVTIASSKDPRSRTLSGLRLRKSKPDATTGNKRSTFGSKTTDTKNPIQKEEERRKRMEELLIRREKRIAEKSGVNGGSPMKFGSSQIGRKAKPQTSAEETKKPKPILRSSTIERLAAAKTSPTAQPKKEALKKVNINKSLPTGKKAGGHEIVNAV